MVLIVYSDISVMNQFSLFYDHIDYMCFLSSFTASVAADIMNAMSAE